MTAHNLNLITQNIMPPNDRKRTVTKQTKLPSDSIIVTEARDRFLDVFEREMLPANVKNSLNNAALGDMQAQYLVMLAMIDTWPRLQKCMREIKLAARKAAWEVCPYAERGEEPLPADQELAKEVESFIWKMKPEPTQRLLGFEGMIEALVEGYYLGHQVIEPHWKKTEDGWLPTCVKVLPARYYGYTYNEAESDRLKLDPKGLWGSMNLTDFPPHRFIIAINSSHSGHPSMGAPLRALTPYWLAAVYGLKWAMLYSQLFGIPFRWATYADDADKAEVAAMLRNIGSAGWGAFKSGTDLKFEDSSKGASSLPQFELMKMADEQCDIFMLGQSLTSSVGDSGSRALGEVHMGVRKDLIEGVCDFVGECLTHQLVPAWAFWNYGTEKENLPSIWAKWPEVKDEKAMADRDVALGLTDGTLPVSRQWYYERHSIPMPSEEDQLLVEAKPVAAAKSVQAANAALKPRPVDILTENVLEGLTGVSQEWLRPIKPFFDRLAALAMSKTATDEDFIEALRKAQTEMPELFDKLNTESLQMAFEEAIGSGLLSGATERLVD